MTKAGLIALLGFSVAAAGTLYASYRGVGVTQPSKQPVSLRERSVKQQTGYFSSRRHRTVFLWGGTRGGK